MKKALALCLSALLILGITACNSENTPTSTSSDTTASTTESTPLQTSQTTTAEMTTETTTETTTESTTETTTETTTEETTTETTPPEPQILPAAALDKTAIANHEAISLWPENAMPYAKEDSALTATIRAYLVDGSDEAVIIFPGGGYFQVTLDGEGTQVAKAYNEQGMSAFVVSYRYKPYEGDAILADGQRAVQWVRYYASELGINPNKLAVCGFSAGGHLAVMTAQHAPEENLASDEIGEVSSKPNACILAYPVVTLGDGTYVTMPEIFLGENKDNAELIKKYSYEYAISSMPATFVFTSKQDSTVDYKKNAKAISTALTAAGITVQYKEYSDGGHGVGLGTNHKQYSAWLRDSVSFLKTKVGF